MEPEALEGETAENTMGGFECTSASSATSSATGRIEDRAIVEPEALEGETVENTMGGFECLSHQSKYILVIIQLAK